MSSCVRLITHFITGNGRVPPVCRNTNRIRLCRPRRSLKQFLSCGHTGHVLLPSSSFSSNNASNWKSYSLGVGPAVELRLVSRNESVDWRTKDASIGDLNAPAKQTRIWPTWKNGVEIYANSLTTSGTRHRNDTNGRRKWETRYTSADPCPHLCPTTVDHHCPHSGHCPRPVPICQLTSIQPRPWRRRCRLRPQVYTIAIYNRDKSSCG